jgi:hypothetical protein
MLDPWSLCKSVHSVPPIMASRLAFTRFLKIRGVLPVKRSQPPPGVPRSSAWLSGPRALPLLLWLVGSLALCWPSTTLAQSPTTVGSTQADPSSSGPYVIGGLILAGLLVALYSLLRALRRHEWPDVGHIVGIVAPTTAITAGVRLAVVSISADSLGPFESQDRVFIPPARGLGACARIREGDL